MSAYPLYLLRHGAPETEGLLLGRTDSAATTAGIAACAAQADDLDVDAILCSDLLRARACAEGCAAPRKLAVTVDARWREIDFGAWDGLAPDAIDPAALGRFWDDPDANPPPGGERWSAFTARVGAALAAIAPRPTLVVTHGGAMRAALAVLCGFEQRRLWAFDLPYAAVLALRVWPGEAPAGQIVGLWG